jgi:hypothetical protein
MHPFIARDHVAQRIRAIGGVGFLSIAMLAGTAGVAHAASVTPTPINDGNPTCADFNAAWTQFKLEGAQLADGTYSDGTLEVTISGYVASDSGTPGSFDWTSNIGVDAVFVKAGSDKHNLYVYDPESLGDTDLDPQAGNGNGISHISFCYDEDGDEPTPPADEPTPPADEPTPPADEPTPPAEEEPQAPGDPTPSPSGEVQSLQGTPDPTLPPTDTVGAAAAPASGSIVPAMLVTGLLGGIALFLVRAPVGRAR